MRNHVDELLLMAAVWSEPRIQRSQIPVCSRKCQQSANARHVHPVLRARWELVEGRLTLIWSEVQEEPLRCAA
jgi:hypothetical protein